MSEEENIVKEITFNDLAVFVRKKRRSAVVGEGEYGSLFFVF